MSRTTAQIYALTRDSLEELFQRLQEGQRPLPYPTVISCRDIDSEDLLEFTVVWEGVQPLSLSMALSEAYRAGQISEEIDPNISIKDKSGFAGKYLKESVELCRLKSHIDRQTKRTNVLARELLDIKQTIKDTNDLTGDMYLQHTVMMRAVMHMNQQLSLVGATPFDFSTIQIQKH
jgi:hypothetical protein